MLRLSGASSHIPPPSEGQYHKEDQITRLYASDLQVRVDVTVLHIFHRPVFCFKTRLFKGWILYVFRWNQHTWTKRKGLFSVSGHKPVESASVLRWNLVRWVKRKELDCLRKPTGGFCLSLQVELIQLGASELDCLRTPAGGFCHRFHVERTQMGPTDRANLSPDTNW
jgi:hypothetical protein